MARPRPSARLGLNDQKISDPHKGMGSDPLPGARVADPRYGDRGMDRTDLVAQAVRLALATSMAGIATLTPAYAQDDLGDVDIPPPDPDLVPLQIGAEQIERVRAGLPELAEEKRARFERDYGLSAYDAGLLTQSRALADFFANPF